MGMKPRRRPVEVLRETGIATGWLPECELKNTEALYNNGLMVDSVRSVAKALRYVNKDTAEYYDDSGEPNPAVHKVRVTVTVAIEKL